MLDQFFFNGIGNYLRAEILYRFPHSPFTPAQETFSNARRLRQLLRHTHNVCQEAYQLGGAQIMTWRNPFGIDPSPLRNWLRCYGKTTPIKDKNGRTFWVK